MRTRLALQQNLTLQHRHLLPGYEKLVREKIDVLDVCNGRDAKETKADVVRGGKKEKKKELPSKRLDRRVPV